MNADAQFSEPNSIQKPGFLLACTHQLAQSTPKRLAIYRNLDAIPDWLTKTKKYCQKPAANAIRAADWFLDNDYQMARAVRGLRADLSPDFYNRLPALLIEGRGLIPRVFDLAQDLIENAEPQLSFAAAKEYVSDYQKVSALTNAELWALPLMLRLVCLEHLIDSFHHIDASLTPPFVVSEQTKRARIRRPVDRISRSITNLIAVQAIKWPDFVDQSSAIEALLSKDPAGVYSHMSFDTRDHYRKRVEQLAQRSELGETQIASEVVKLSEASADCTRKGHVGFWLIDAGRADLEKMVSYKRSVPESLVKVARRYNVPLYFSALFCGLLLSLILPIAYLYRNDANFWLWAAGISLSLIPASLLSVYAVHWLITKIVRPQTLPELDFRKAIPLDFATAIVVPVIVGNVAEVSHIAEAIELRRLANPDPALRFVLLSDFVDAPSETMPEDEAILNALIENIRRLNARYDLGDGGPFILMHRSRQYNRRQDCWMGWERKRGKLEQFNRHVLGKEVDGFACREGKLALLRGTRFAIVLDADTELPPNSASRLVGILAHPLNRPVFDEKSKKLVAGYTIIQPRIEILPHTGSGTLFSHLYSGDTAIDIYSRAVSDVYQDMFGSGVFVGKGIYDIEAVDKTLAGRVPENAILSHDLFEGIHGRAALASNVIFYEDFPETYTEYARRSHRWVRGDWQLLPWLGRYVPSASEGRLRNSFSALDRWKILDNLRRSLVPPSLLLFFFAAWNILPGSASIWTVLAIAAPGSYLVGELYAVARGGIRQDLIGDVLHRIIERGGRWFLSIVFLVSDTLNSVDAIVRTLWRVFISKQNLLEWKSAAHSTQMQSNGNIRSHTWRMMWPSTVISALIAVDLAIFEAAKLIPAAPILMLWLCAPEIAVWTAKPRQVRQQTLRDDQQGFLQEIARRTWHFFETFAGPDDNWLPPDNFQEDPRGIIAHRTSPTNIGMLLVSSLAARDFGFITSSDFVARTRNTLDTIERLKTYRGHLLNWYDTQSLAPLEPQYVSTVDSGNLAVALIAYKQGCLETERASPLTEQCWDGLSETFNLLLSALRTHAPIEATLIPNLVSDIPTLIKQARSSPQVWRRALREIQSSHWPIFEKHISTTIKGLAQIPPETLNEVHTWLDRFTHHLRVMQRDLEFYFPWIDILAAPPSRLAALGSKLARELAPGQPCDRILETIEVCQSELQSKRRSDQFRKVDLDWANRMIDALSLGKNRHKELAQDLAALARRADRLAFGMDFTFLYNPAVRLFAIGYNVSSGRLDHSHYDLLATEARLASYFALAKHDAPIEHWYFFNRPITRLAGKPSILSWNGSMFEYLMPPLFLPSRRDTLLGESEITAVEYQRRYAKKRGVPWGISESAFGVTDADGNYQYRAFGVPGLGIRRGLSEDLVISPYASALALCAWPRASVENLQVLAGLGALKVFGFWEALDFTPGRAHQAQDFVPVKTYMAHHQGMIIAAILNILQNDVLVNRVLREKSLQTIDLLLQERVPWELPIEKGRLDESWDHQDPRAGAAIPAPWVPSSASSVPQLHVLGNGRLSSVVSESGSGGLSWQKNAITRWRPDPTRDAHGYWIYIQDVERDTLWSAGRQPVGIEGEDHKTLFHQHMAETFRRDHDIATRVECVIAPFSDVDIRRVTVTNEGRTERTIQVTSYAECVLAPPLDDERHPAFSKLFIGASYQPADNGLVFERRSRRPEDVSPVMLHKLVTDDLDIKLRGHETDRALFIGRNGSLRNPRALQSGLSGTTGWTLDPVMALQVQIRLRPGETKQFSFLTAVAESREETLDLSRSFSPAVIDRTFRDAALEAARQIVGLELDSARLPELQVLSSLLLQHAPVLRKVDPSPQKMAFGQPDLWRFGISGDLPILLIRADEDDDPELLELLIRAHRLWHKNGLRIDFVILRIGTTGYEAPMRERLMSMLRETDAESFFGRNGGIHLISEEQMDHQVRRGLEAACHVVLPGDIKSLRELLDRVLESPAPSPLFEVTQAADYRHLPPPRKPQSLSFFNGYGGFDAEAGEYVIHLEAGETTPAPWCNVICNDDFGSIVSESGLGFTWAINSGEHRLTPWSNDPVSNPPGEAIYLRDEVTAQTWTITPAPMADRETCLVRHGKGYTSWSKNSQELEQEMLAFVPIDTPVKIVRLKLKNRSEQDRRITATYYAEWLLGALESTSKPHISCDYHPDANAIIATNNWNPEFEHRAAFLTASQPPHSTTGSRHDFLGLEGDYSFPAAMKRWDLGGNFTPGGDSCAAYQVHLDIPAGETCEVVFVLGEATNTADVKTLAAHWSDLATVADAFEDLSSFWKTNLSAVQVNTPDTAFDLMVNQWLPYQNLASRIMARAGFYQAGGAFGYRDQLQDMLALLYAAPDRVRRHILLAAESQFEAGDALHWWHPPAGKGVRTRCSDDYLWLPYVTSRYVEATGDSSILDVEVPYLRGPELRPEEHDRYARFDQGETATLYDHCMRALDRMMVTGQHDLPLIGTGDWNDGMDRVGDEGRGESVWLAWFQISVISRFSQIAEPRGEPHAVARWRDYSARLRAAAEEVAWDGSWFKRAFDDDGEPWGSSSNEECQIDSIAQSWSVLSDAASKGHQITATASAAARLIDDTNRLVKLLDPPFHNSQRDPGYIQAYPVGVRENGGQYTHAAAWLGFSFAKLGDGDMAWHIFDTINPIRRVSNKQEAALYRREPYVLAGDVSGGERKGQGGWSWYTGAAGWTWQLGVEGILGVSLKDDHIVLDPSIPLNWGKASIVLETKRGCISIDIRDPDRVGSGILSIKVDGQQIDGNRIGFPGPGKSCSAIVILGKREEDAV